MLGMDNLGMDIIHLGFFLNSFLPYWRVLTIPTWCDSFIALESPRHCHRIGVPYHFCDVANIIFGLKDQIFCLFNTIAVEVI